jgi:DNA-binding NtrC family response regulator
MKIPQELDFRPERRQYYVRLQPNSMRTLPEPNGLVGNSPAIETLREEIAYASRCDAKVLITGESGAGKEIVARLIHSGSGRRQSPLVTVNCAALTETLLETELFGHVRGSFTGAYRDRQGVFERANGGSVFMDEIGETTPRMQGLLLRFLETGELQRVGSEERVPTRVNVRVIAATNRVLMQAVADKLFREDLYYRLNVIHLQVPALRNRREDIPELLRYFLGAFSRQYSIETPDLSPVAQTLLTEYAWPGNVRELKNVIERLVVRNRSRVVQPEDLPVEVLRRASGVPVASSAAVTNAGAGSSMPAPAAPGRSKSDELFEGMLKEGQSFWSLVYAPFMSRDLTRDDLRAIVRKGLERTSGNYKVMTELFNMPPQDYKRFLGFLRKYHCHMPFQQFRSAAGARLNERASDSDSDVALTA